MQQECNRSATGAQQKCNRSATGVQPECNRSATGVQQECNRSATGVQQERNRSATGVQQECNRSVTGAQQECNSARRARHSSCGISGIRLLPTAHEVSAERHGLLPHPLRCGMGFYRIRCAAAWASTASAALRHGLLPPRVRMRHPYCRRLARYAAAPYRTRHYPSLPPASGPTPTSRPAS